MDIVSGFSKLSKKEKIKWLADQFDGETSLEVSALKRFWTEDVEEQELLDELSENTISNFHLPFGIAPNFLINNKIYAVPMVIEESSVVAAAGRSAKFWLGHGGFQTRVIGSVKAGQVHFSWHGNKNKLINFFELNRSELLFSVKDLTKNMEKRGGGILSIDLVDKTDLLEDYYQLDLKFETCDAMGANFINSVLEHIADKFQDLAKDYHSFSDVEKDVEIIMSILSNYTPECLVQAYVECPVEELENICPELSGYEFAKKFEKAVMIAKVDPNRAVTHNKGIFNGIDAVVLASGNDFRAIEACGHAYAAKDGQYRGLSSCFVKDGMFRFELTLPMAVGTVGGLTSLHPMSKLTLQVLDKPSAKELMQIIASVGLAQNFGAVRSLVTTGIQKGHMKMHLLNILKQLKADERQIQRAKEHFEDKTISFSEVRDFLSLGMLH